MAARITVNNNGSLRIEGDVQIVDQAGAAYDLAGRAVVSLCRCGGSSRKPFCDGSHRTNGFSSICTAFTLEPPKQQG
jgi:CDGSH-type Zn-finger protein